MAKELLRLENLCKYYTSAQSVVMGLNNISLSFCAGEFVAITGESGSGKSTLAKVLAGILPYESGELLVEGRPTSHYDGADWERYRSERISFISQSYDILPGCTVMRNVVSALRLTGMEKGEAAVRAEEILRQVELWELKGRRAAKLSSGQKQRLSIARALAKPAPILIADEPTGNLDPENSAKVIGLLAAAARERLVIMITHEFDEAADYATRRITMRDSVVTADVILRPMVSQQEREQIRKKRIRGLSLYTARLQMSARPVWSTIMLVFFALTAFAVFAFLGTFIVNLDDTHTRIYDNSAFRNGAMERIVVVHPNGEDLTQADWEKLLELDHVTALERYGYVTDVNYFYRDGVDYLTHYVASGGGLGEGDKAVEQKVTLESATLFLQTVPVIDGAFLTAGRLPETIHEVVAGDESLLGQTITVYVQDVKNWNRTAWLTLEATVVGTTDQGEHLYFADQLGRMFTNYLRHDDVFVIPNDTDDLEGKFLCSSNLYKQMQDWILRGGSGTHQFTCYGAPGQVLELELAGTHDCSLLYALEVSPENFELMVEDSCGPQVTLTIEDYAYTDQVLEEIRALGYGALSPYQMGSNQQSESLAAERMQTLKVCLLALCAVILLQVVVLRAMFAMEHEEYRLLANLGLRCHTAKRSVGWQMVWLALGGEVLAVLAVLLCGTLGVERIVSVLRYLPGPYVLLIWVVHFGAALLTSLWVNRAMKRQVYPVTGSGTDLAMDEEVEA